MKFDQAVLLNGYACSGLISDFMRSIFFQMTLGLAVSGSVAYVSASSPFFLHNLFVMNAEYIQTLKPLGWVVMVLPLFFVIILSAFIKQLSLNSARLLYWTYSVLVGLSLSTIFLNYTGESMASILFISAATFASMSFVGYFTKTDLTKFGSLLIMGLFGLMISSITNLFLQNSRLQLFLSIAGILIFVGLTAYDVQKLKSLYYNVRNEEEWKGKIEILGALTLYLDVLNIFLDLLFITQSKKNSF